MLKVVRDDNAVEHETLDAPAALDLDEICRLAARQMLAVALEAERRAWLEQHHTWSTRPGGGWWWATATYLSARS